MGDTFKLHGDITSAPSSGYPSGAPSVSVPIDESMSLKRAPTITEYTLDSDSPQSVAFGAAATASVVMIKSVGGKVRVRLTSADGSSQAVAVDSFAIIMSSAVPYTAIDLTRVAGVTTVVKVLLGEKS